MKHNNLEDMINELELIELSDTVTLIIKVKGGHLPYNQMEELQDRIHKTIKKPILMILMDINDSMEALPEDEMRKFGWVRSEESLKQTGCEGCSVCNYNKEFTTGCSCRINHP